MEKEPSQLNLEEYEQLALFGLEKVLQHRYQEAVVIEIKDESLTLLPYGQSEPDTFIVNLESNDTQDMGGGPEPSGELDTLCMNCALGGETCSDCKSKEETKLPYH